MDSATSVSGSMTEPPAVTNNDTPSVVDDVMNDDIPDTDLPHLGVTAWKTDHPNVQLVEGGSNERDSVVPMAVEAALPDPLLKLPPSTKTEPRRLL
jgi:hypothetical protein